MAFQKSRLEELSAGLFDNEDEGEEVGDIDKLSVNPPVRREDKKDEKKRKKEKRRKEVVGILLSPYLCFISFLYLDLYVLGDDALIS